MDRNKWKEPSFKTFSPPNYPCPHCQHGVLENVSFEKEITVTGMEQEEIRYPFGTNHYFAGILKCNQSSCRLVVSYVGECNLDAENEYQNEHGEWEIDAWSEYIPKFFYPNLRLFPLPRKISKSVKEQIDLSFSHFFNDYHSCANRIRTAIEYILNDLGATKKKKNSKGKLVKLSTLDSRIEHFRKKNRRLAELMMAIKFIGNEGSHPGQLNREDILDAFEILSLITETAYGGRQDEVVRIASEINAKRKPRSH